MKYNILYISSFGSLQGGGQRSLLLLLKYLNRDIFAPLLIVPQEGELSQSARDLNIKVFVLPFARIRGINIIGTVFGFAGLCAILRDNKVDIIHTDSPRETFYAGLAKLFFPVLVIIHLRVSDTLGRLERMLYRVCDSLIAVSSSVAGRFRELDTQSKLRIIYNAVELDVFQPLKQMERTEKELLIGYFGRVERRKGLETLINAVRSIGSRVKAIVQGSGDEEYREELKRLAAGSPIVFKEYAAQVREEMSAVDVVVLPSVLGEGLSRLLIEAMALGKVVAASDFPENREAMGEDMAEFIFPAGDAAALAAILNRINTERNILSKKAPSVRLRAERLFDARKNTREIELVYYSLMAERENNPALKEICKSIIMCCGLGKTARFLRSCGYAFFDIAGTVLFSALKILRIGPKDRALEKEKPEKILIIRSDRVGDLVLSTPAIRAVRNKFPQARIDLMVNDYARDIVLSNPYVNKLLSADNAHIDNDYDLAIALHPGLRQNYLLWKSGAGVRVGYTGWGGGFLLTHRLKDDRIRRPRHEVEFTLEAAALIGCSLEDKTLEVFETEEGRQFSIAFFRDNRLEGQDVVIIHPGARQRYVRWNKAGFAAVADKLIQECKVKVILTGAESERTLIEDIMSMMREEAVPCVGIRLTQLISLMKLCRMYLGNITGPLHIAAAVGIPVVAITGMKGSLDDARYWGPWCKDYALVQKDTGCRQCHPSDCRDLACMHGITAEEVFAAGRKMLDSHGA
ncbi:MAG: glycosyltransferase [Candidatus Omnitrophica bacterium]|nr:glycosyltransferase [Candidatus Omnitrophota bacterium]MBU4477815.1 glycosyltransferase [Candidatus Omnitrophota bacterium]MCG2703549.1 glycosyltransferase [Candidatus Omnitrophota bacterium]